METFRRWDSSPNLQLDVYILRIYYTLEVIHTAAPAPETFHLISVYLSHGAFSRGGKKPEG